MVNNKVDNKDFYGLYVIANVAMATTVYSHNPIPGDEGPVMKRITIKAKAISSGNTATSFGARPLNHATKATISGQTTRAATSTLPRVL